MPHDIRSSALSLFQGEGKLPLKIVHNVANRLSDFLFPPLCILCDKPRVHDSRWFCPECIDSLQQNHANRNPCKLCSQNKNVYTCTCEFGWDFPFEWIVSILDYDDTVKKIMHHIKYRYKKHLAFEMGVLFSDTLPEQCYDVDIVIAIPLHKARLRKRGYNQAEWFARGLIEGKRSAVPFMNNIVERKRNTKTQTKLDKAKRRHNLEGAFCIDSQKAELIKGKSVLLVDDVITTGATTSVCAEVLLAAGCQSVRVASLVRD